MRRLTGIGVSPGVVAGRAVVLVQRAQALRYQITESRIERELERLEQSRVRSREQLVEIRERIARRRRELAALFDAQLLMLEDPMLVPRASEIVREQRVNAEWAVQQVLHELSAVFDDAADPYLRERQGDVADLIGRLRMNLRSGGTTPRDFLRELDESSILIADELTPSLAAQIDWGRVRGFATDAGSRTYHTAILARSLDVPAIVGLHDASAQVQAGQMVVLDGSASCLILDPTPDEIERASHHADDHQPSPREDEDHRPAETADGVRIRLEANIEFSADLAAARYAGAEGIGLYRTEFQLANAARDIENEDRQYEIYKELLDGMAPGPVTVRTFDMDERQLTTMLSADPRARGWAQDEERGSRGGLRGLRLSLLRPELFRVQLRALLRAARHGDVRILFPFVSSVEELREGRAMVAEAERELTARGIDVPRVPIGVMIEIPAAAYAADLLAHDADFFTIGTNDLIQYCLAVDRADDRVSRLYEPLHPAILRLIVMVRRAARRHGIPVSLCGEMASDPALLALLVGLGLRDFSMTPGAIPVARHVLRHARSADLHALARRVMRLSTIDEIERELLTAVGNSGRLNRITGGVPS